MGQWPCRFLLCLWRLAIWRLCVVATKFNRNYLTYMTKIRWCSVDAHFQNGAVTISLPVLPIKAGNTMDMSIRDNIGSLLPYLPDQNSLTLRWRSFSEWGSDCIAFFIAYKGWQYDCYVNQRPDWFVITLRTWPKTGDAPLMLIFRMRQWPCGVPFRLSKLPIRWLFIFATKFNGNYLPYMTKIRWRSIDAHFQNGAVTVSLCGFPIKTAKTLILNGRSQISTELPYLQFQKSLTFHWRTFSEWDSDRVAICFANKDCQHIGFALQWPIQYSITLLMRPKIVDTPLTLILMKCQVKICCHW